MLGFQYVVAKSRELSSALDRELSAASSRSTPFRSVPSVSPVESAASASPELATDASISGRNEGQLFLRAQQNLHARAVSNHQKLMQSGQQLDATLAKTRANLQAQAASDQFLAQNFHLVSRVRQQLAGVRNLVLKLAEEAEEVENLLVQRCEEDAARQNAEFASEQQQELEHFEARIARESEGRKKELLEMRRQKLARAFMNDLRTYQTLVGHHGEDAAKEAGVGLTERDQVTLDEVDLVVTADADQLDAFYDSGSEAEEDKSEEKADAGEKQEAETAAQAVEEEDATEALEEEETAASMAETVEEKQAQ